MLLSDEGFLSTFWKKVDQNLYLDEAVSCGFFDEPFLKVLLKDCEANK